MDFVIIERNVKTPSSGSNVAYLKIDHWNDFSFVTMFYLTVFDQSGRLCEPGNIKIGFKGQTTSESTYSKLGAKFQLLPEGFFSLGAELDFYKKLADFFPIETRQIFLGCLRDVVCDEKYLNDALGEDVFSTSLLRGVSMVSIREQFRRVLDGGVPLTDFSFLFRREKKEDMAGLELTFDVKSSSKPSTNIHAIIGRNGVGKTTVLNGMVGSITGLAEGVGGFFQNTMWQKLPISSDYFSSLVSVSFSAFDPFNPPPEQSDPAKGTCYYYIGLQNLSDSESKLKDLTLLRAEYAQALGACMSQAGRKKRWIQAILALESDENFADMDLTRLLEFSGGEFRQKALDLISRMSSGHAVVLLTMTKLVATVEEKTLVLIDEPESHLHPPLLSAFIRALSELLHDRNGVAIIATHSPVVLQEIPSSCAWKINRSRLEISTSRPDVQTFGENVGVLTREVFGLEVSKAGFHKILEGSVNKGGSFEEILAEYGGQLGYEAQAILRAMILNRDKGERQ